MERYTVFLDRKNQHCENDYNTQSNLQVQCNPYQTTNRASLVAQWLRIRLPMQETQVRSLVREDPTCHGATEPMSHNYWACTLEPVSHNYRACMLQLLKPVCLEPVLCNKRSHHSEKPMHSNEEWPPLAASRENSQKQQWRPKAAKNK